MLYCKNLSFKIGTRKLIDSLNFNLEANQHLLIFGPSGCGKTTLLSILSGLQKPDSGHITYNDIDLYNLKEGEIDHFRGQNLGIIFQTFHLIKALTVYQNVVLALKFSCKKIEKEKIDHYLERLHLLNKSNQKVETLSVGEKQRLAVARAVITNPKWILCDEPTSALDNTNTEKMLRLLENEAQNCNASLIIVTHDQRVKSHFKNQKIIEF